MVTRIRVPELFQVMNILEDIERHEKTGELLLTQGKQWVKLYFLQGKIVYIDSLAGLTIGERLVQSGVISQEDLQLAMYKQEARKNNSSPSSLQVETSIINILTELGLVSIEQLQDSVVKDATEILQSIFTWKTGEVSFDEGKVLPPDRLPVALYATSLISTIFDSHSILDDEATQIFKGPNKKSSTLRSFNVSHFKTPKPDLEEKSGNVISPPDIYNTPTKIQRVAKQPAMKSTVSSVPADGITYKIGTVQKRRNFILRWEALVIVAVLLIAGLAHGINMFHFPYFENDEGTYMSQAWSVIHEGKLAPYTYWYDHAPIGWLQIAIWVILTAGFHTFGPIINSGRVLMLLMQLGSTLMLYYIARNISRSIIIAVLVVLLFALSPYGIYYHRRVLLDNIMTFWMLLSILPLIAKKVSLKKVWLSAIALGISILSKEVAIFTVPVMIYLVFSRSHKSHRWYAVMGWITVVSLVVSWYPLYSVLNNELFPSGTLLGGTAPHVSLIGTLQYQASRGKDGGLFDVHSGFWYMVSNWVHDDPLSVIAGSFGAIISVFAIRKQRLIGIMGLITLSLWAFLARGGEIIGFYLVPLLPFLALNIGLVVGLIFDILKRYVGSNKIISVFVQSLRLITIAACLVGILGGYSSPNVGLQQNHFLLWNSNQTGTQNQAISWVEAHISPKSVIVVDDSSWTDLYDTGTSVSFKNVQWYWKVDLDPAIRINVFHNDWRNIDYMVVTGQMMHDAQASNLTLVETALVHSTVIARFNTGSWPVEIRKVDK